MSSSSKKEEERNEKIIRGLMKLPPNRRCINCNSLGPQYVCTNFWTFVCMTCSGIHREFTHRVKSVSMSKFTSQEVESLQEGGNQRARETFLKDWDPREQRLPDNSNVDKVRDFIKSVYVDKKFSASKASGKPPRDTMSHRNHEDETRRASSYHSYSQSPPYDYQYEERRYGKQAPALTKKPGSDRGMMRFMSTSRLSDHVQEDRFANEVANARVSDYSGNNGGDLFRSDTQSPPSLSHSSGSGKFDSLDLFSAPNAPQPTTSAPSVETGKFDGLDLFSAPNAPQRTTSAPPAESGKFDGLDLFGGPNAPQPTTFAPSAETGKFGGLDLFSAPTAPQRTTSAPSAETGKFDGLDLFSGPNAPQPTTSAPSAETNKFDSLDLFTATYAPHSTTPSSPAIDLFDLSATSSASAAPTLNVNPQFQAFEPSLGLFSVMPQQHSSENLISKESDGWASFDMPWHAQPSQQDFNASGPFGAPVNEKNNQSWSSFDESSTSFENIYTETNEQDHVVSDPYVSWGASENLKMKQADFDARPTPFLTPTPHAIDETQSYGLDTKSRNPFDFPDDGDLESSDMFFDMSSMQTSLPNHNMSTPWFPDGAAIPYTPDALVYMAGQTSNMQIPNVQAQGHVASVGGNPFG